MGAARTNCLANRKKVAPIFSHDHALVTIMEATIKIKERYIIHQKSVFCVTKMASKNFITVALVTDNIKACQTLSVLRFAVLV